MANLDIYDVILGMLFLYQHQILLGLNPAQVTIWSIDSLMIQAPHAVTLESWAATLKKDKVEQYWTQLQDYMHDICKEAIDMPLLLGIAS